MSAVGATDQGCTAAPRPIAGKFVIDGQETPETLKRKLRLVAYGDGNVRLECNEQVLFIFESGVRTVLTDPAGGSLSDITGLDIYYGGRTRVRLDTDG